MATSIASVMWHQPGVALLPSDTEGQVAQPQPRVPALLGVGRRPAPVLDQEQREPLPRATQVGRLRIQAYEHRILRDTVVERVDEATEERTAADAFVQAGRSAALVTAPDDRLRLVACSLTVGHGTVRVVADRPSVLSPELSAYIAAHAAPPDDVLRDLQQRTAEFGRAARMQVSSEEGALLTLLTKLVGARQAVELGTFTGYSSICIARGLADGGRLVCCDVSEEYTAFAKDAWEQAGLTDRIELRIGPALDSVRALPTEPHLDLSFIDADKASYAAYYDELLPRTRAGGVILVDNTLWSGRVLDQDVDDADTVAMRAFNDKVAADDRVDAVILPVSDGLTLIRKR